MLPEEIIIAPVVTESNDELQEGKYTFKVIKSNKVEIRGKLLKNFSK